MERSNAQRGVLVFLAVLALAAAAILIPRLLSGEEGESAPPDNPGNLVGSEYEEIPAGVDTGNPSAVAEAALRTAYTINPLEVASMNQSVIRARGLISPAYHAELRNNDQPTEAFEYWRTHGVAWMATSIEEMAHDESLDSPTKVYRTYRIVQERDPRSTSTLPQSAQRHEVHVLLTKYQGSGWKVDRIW